MDNDRIVARNILQQAANLPRTIANSYIEQASPELISRVVHASAAEAAKLVLSLLPHTNVRESPPEVEPVEIQKVKDGFLASDSPFPRV